MKAIVTVVGKDTVGIIADVCSQLAACGVNVLDISQTVLHGYFTMIMMADLDGASSDFAAIAEQLAENGKKRGLDIRMQREDLFQEMHRI